tara:strand:+ start:124 stop:279 length:156 start_codon:yes stop_codon:yes gene_type:complete
VQTENDKKDMLLNLDYLKKAILNLKDKVYSSHGVFFSKSPVWLKFLRVYEN